MTQQAPNGSKEDIDKKNKVLVVGASGLIGVAAIEAFLGSPATCVLLASAQDGMPLI